MAAPFALIFGEGLSEARFLCPSGTRNARFFVLRHRAWGTGGKRQPCGLLRTAQSDPKVGSETSGGRGQRPPRRLSDRELPQTPAGAQGSVCPVGTWAEGPKRPEGAPKGSVSPVGTWARGPKRPEGVSKYKGCARPAHRTPIFARAAKPCARRRGASARWAVARSAKRPAGVSKYKGCARQRTERRYLRKAGKRA